MEQLTRVKTTLVAIVALIASMVPQTAKSQTALFNANVTSGCEPLTVNFANLSTNATSYYWTFGNGNSSTLANPTTVYTSPGTYTVTLVAINGTSRDTLVRSNYIFVPVSPVPDFSVNTQTGCETGNVFNFTNLTINGNTYTWDFGDGNVSNETHPHHLYTSPGQFPVTLTVTTAEGCIDTLSLTQVDLVDINPTPVAAFAVDRTEADICNSVINFTNQSQGAVTYYYHFDDGYNYSTQESPSQKFYTSGDHHVYMIATSDKGCTDTAFQKIYIEPFAFFIPNTFTPDGDEFNNVLEAKMWLTPFDWEFRIYNRWGEMVFESFDYRAVWDGTYKGELVPSGMYNYTLKYRPCSMEDHHLIQNGHVNVLK